VEISYHAERYFVGFIKIKSALAQYYIPIYNPDIMVILFKHRGNIRQAERRPILFIFINKAS
jgi:hypothetical protein